MAKKSPTIKSVETIRHADRRKNIPTAEHQSVLEQEDARPRPVRYPRNTDLDPQLVWRGKDEQDWSDLVVQAPPLYIQEKVHPKALIDDLLRRSAEDARAAETQIDMFGDFNGIPDGADSRRELWATSYLKAVRGAPQSRGQPATIRRPLHWILPIGFEAFAAMRYESVL